MPDSDKEKESNISYEEELTLSEEDLNDGRSYCMACDSPLKNYHSIVCFDCLDEGADLFSDMINNHSEPRTILIDLSFTPKDNQDDEIVEEVIEEEWDDEDEEEWDDEDEDSEYDFDFPSDSDID